MANKLDNIDELVKWINDDSKPLTKKKKKLFEKKMEKSVDNKLEKKQELKNKFKENLHKYDRKNHPFYNI